MKLPNKILTVLNVNHSDIENNANLLFGVFYMPSSLSGVAA